MTLEKPNTIFEPLFDFEWRAHSRYELEPMPTTSSSLGLSSAEEYIFAKGNTGKPYRPIENHKDLHYAFAFQVTNKDMALKFVRDFGFLFSPLGPEKPEDILETAKKMRDILKTIGYMKSWLFPNLERFEAGEKIKFRSDMKEVNNKILAHTVANKKAGLNYDLRKVFNRNVNLMASIRLVPLNEDPSKDSIQVVPINLISWLWLRVAEEIADGTRWRLCKHCHAPFPIYLADKRTEKDHCGKDACRQALHRAKKRKFRNKK